MSNKNLIIIPDDAFIKSINNTFVEYSLEDKSLVGFEPESKQLCDDGVDDDRPSFRPFGVCEHKGSLLISSHKKLASYSKEIKPVEDYRLFLNTHQMCSDGDTLYICNTSVDTIGMHNKSGTTYFNVRTKEFSKECKPAFNSGIRDSKHVNSVTVDNGFLYYCLHNLNVSESTFGRINLDSMTDEHLFDSGYQCHDVLIHKNHLYSNSSGNGFLIQHNFETNETKTYKLADEKQIFLRGMALYNNDILIGMSNNHRNVSEARNSNIFSFSPETLDYKHFMSVPDVLSIADMIVVNEGEAWH